MKLHVTGVEVIEVEDPKGVCDPLPRLDKLPQIRPHHPPPTTPTDWNKPHEIPRWQRNWNTALSGEQSPSTLEPLSPSQPPVKWTRNLRLNTAREQLEAGELKIGETSGNNGTFYTN